ncbi:MATE family efflux transporter [Lachnoclostridium phytofermentans]|uniref:MATE family efflux transporter n=1 Tax=Lachnoclostridium phytofermentans TaxID=66219 RepID=UPI000495693C|nr:MATE family efflux transporter [Lachnoclostridium phytofermentans]
MNKQLNADLGNGSIGKLLFQLSVPAIAAQIINVLYNMVDRAYIGHIPEIGSQALTGVGVTMPVIMAISAFAALVAMGSAPRAGIMLGKKDSNTAEKILGNSFFSLIIVAIILTITILLFGEPILMIFGASENTVGYALDYLNIYAIGTIFVQITLGMNAFISTQGFAKTSMLTVAIGAIINIILDPILIFGFDMGVKGAALATILSQGVSCFWVIRFLTSEKTVLRIKKENVQFNPKIMLPCIALGLAPFIMQFTEAVIAVCFNSNLYKYGGDTAVGAMTILTSIMQFSMLPLQGLTQGSQPIISYNFGAGNFDRIKKTFKLLVISCLSFSTLIWAISMFAPKLFIMIFANSPELIDYSVWAVRIYMAVSCIFGIQIACQQTFIAIGNAKISMFLALLRKVFLLIPLIFILPAFFEDKAFAVFLAEPIADFFAVVTTASMFIYTFKKLGVNKENVMDSTKS